MARIPFETALGAWRKGEMVSKHQAGSQCLSLYDIEVWLQKRGEPWQWRHIAVCEHCYHRTQLLSRMMPEKAVILHRPTLLFCTKGFLRTLLGISRRAAFAGDDTLSPEDRKAYERLLERLRGP